MSSGSPQILQLPVSLGEALDKLTIVEIKLSMIFERNAKENLSREKDAILEAIQTSGHLFQESDYAKLKSVNLQIYKLMDDIFGEEAATPRYAELSKLTVDLNVERSLIKREINLKANSYLVEEKSYFRGE